MGGPFMEDDLNQLNDEIAEEIANAFKQQRHKKFL